MQRCTQKNTGTDTLHYKIKDVRSDIYNKPRKNKCWILRYTVEHYIIETIFQNRELTSLSEN